MINVTSQISVISADRFQNKTQIPSDMKHVLGSQQHSTASQKPLVNKIQHEL